MSARLTIALDAMGGDHAPEIVISGAAIARRRFPQVDFLFFGDQARIDPLIDEHPKLRRVSTVRHTDMAVSAHERPSIALRRGQKTSMQLAINAVRDGEAAGLVSAGNTGALMAMSKVTLKTLPGIDRPAIAAYVPTQVGESVLLDLGANVECDANNLLQFGMLGAAFARTVLGLKRPTVGLLNVGAEEIKGRDMVKQAATLFRNVNLPFTFHGFVEGDDIGTGAVDVFVVDGFTGNVVLKSIEGTVRLYTDFLRRSFRNSLVTKLSYLLARGAFKQMRARIDPRRYNGATFLGLNGIVVKSHGGADAFGFANAIGVAVDMAANGIIEFIMRELEQSAEDPLLTSAQAAVS
ncbi:MAG: phosphate acyltransferase PlsX [Alphaproteobacteria bacterium]|nr:phosphate acyltransferase PlsX [Alphaproteobacteria bacterium]